MTMTTEQLPLLPYAGTSGWSGSDTSRARAERADNSGVTASRQRQVLDLLEEAGHDGMTVHEVDRATGWLHHGTTSGALSDLHLEGAILRLKDTRDRCKIYVLPRFRDGRATEPHGRNKPGVAPGTIRVSRADLNTVLTAYESNPQEWEAAYERLLNLVNEGES